MDEISFATVDERAVAKDDAQSASASFSQVFSLNGRNNGQSQYITIHHQECSNTKIRNE